MGGKMPVRPGRLFRYRHPSRPGPETDGLDAWVIQFVNGGFCHHLATRSVKAFLEALFTGVGEELAIWGAEEDNLPTP